MHFLFSICSQRDMFSCFNDIHRICCRFPCMISSSLLFFSSLYSSNYLRDLCLSDSITDNLNNNKAIKVRDRKNNTHTINLVHKSAHSIKTFGRPMEKLQFCCLSFGICKVPIFPDKLSPRKIYIMLWKPYRSLRWRSTVWHL